ncbi:MAG TPA: hypothetical protein VH253_09595 [Phycisphaerae bacterium]|nr:hypothetical protein [Phycisphaerae bacterium]
MLAMGVGLYGAFLPTARSRWAWAMHDRGVHALAAIKIATSLRGGDLATFFSELLKPKLYPPLQAILGGLAAVIAGPHYRIVALPSLLGWMLMIVCGCGIAYRIARPSTRLLAGFIVAAFMVASPADRFYATDTMLESLGAGLTAAVLFCYVLVRERAEPGRLRWLAIALTLLFFEKYNYWLLVVIGLCVDVLADAAIRAWLVAFARRNGAAIVRHLLRQPLLWGALAVLIGTLVIARRGETAIGGLSLYPPRGLLTAAVWLIAGQIGLEFFRFGRERWRGAPAWLRELWSWHGLPLLIWLMLPARLWTILFFVSTSNAGDARYPGLAGLRYYAQCLAEQYAVGWWGLAPAAVLAVAGGIVAVRRGRGARGVLAVLVVGALLAGLHPNKQGRYLHSWIPALWILSGVGGAALLGALERRWRAAGIAVAVVAAAGIAVWFGRSILREPTGHDEMAQYHPTGTLLEATDAYLPLVEGVPRVAIFAPSGWPVVEWTFLEHFGDGRGGTKLEMIRWPGDETPAQAAAATREWLRTTRDGAAVVITPLDPAKPSLWTRDGYESPGITEAVNRVLQAPGSGFVTEQIQSYWMSNTAVAIYVRGASPRPASAASEGTATGR